MKREIWNNDVCERYDYVSEEYSTDDYTESQLWDIAYDDVRNDLECSQMNLDIEKNGEIFLIGTLQRWNGSVSVHKNLNTRNIGEAMDRALDCFEGDNSFEIYCEDGKMLISQTGHDNPCNPSIMEFRALKKGDFDDLDDESGNCLLKNSVALAKDCSAVYGW
ncbi:MAG: hypothetical protein J5525_12085 [Lachnospiraceae bacterium]|nr:hypothetical protein [Lachnospiraceae bacterium]